ncbi:glycosyltransferase family 2 protein [uncultured Bifidobacterium sp.]|uniref:glycosyltransferase family 2 protein n=1 Tax=uncultured Bifidobacterium sp. TaxID=165187 RepID=UPI00258E8BEB|nr:glycosyltransferase family 2 protein [uncultured Bifidobacterium sp.]
MTSTGNSDIQHILAEQAAAMPLGERAIDHSVAAVITVEEDLRFFGDTVAAVLGQSVLPGTVVVADCTGRTGQPEHSEITVPQGDARGTVGIQIVRAAGARSFFDAVTKGMKYARLERSVTALWTLHDDSRPAPTCLEALLEARRNTPTASLLGSKQLDWSGRNLHNVGSYAGKHHLESLVVDGEPDQEQYDGRRDVFAVSLAGALVPLHTIRTFGGTDPWFGSFAEADDLCRRICLGGGRVVVVPTAEVAHRRARFEGIRTHDGEPLEDDDAANTALGALDAQQRFYYTDVRMLWWPLLWLWRLIRSVVMAVVRLSRKQPYEALCELALPWRALASVSPAVKARRRVVRQGKVPLSRLGVLTANRRQIAQWHDRSQAFHDQRDTVVLNPLARAHLLRRTICRWTIVLCAALLALGIVVGMHWSVFRAAFGGASMTSPLWASTSAGFSELVESATSSWAFGVGTGTPAPATPWLLVLMAASVCTGGHVAAATALMLFAAAPLSVLSFWALAGVFTRSDAVRITSALLWFALSLAMGLYASCNLSMLTVMVFLPAAFAFAFRAVGMYRTEDPVRPHASVQSAAASALCFIPVLASEPQLLLPLVVAFLTFVVFVRGHRATLLLIPLPAAIVLAPTLLNVIRRFPDGAWRQLFGDITTSSGSAAGEPRSLSLPEVLGRAFGMGDVLRLGTLSPLGLAALCVCAVLAVLAVVSLALPFALRASRMMWVVMVTGTVTALVSSRVAVSPQTDGAVAGTVLPGVAMCVLGLLSCACIVAGMAVKRFVPLREGDPRSARAKAVVVGRAALAAVLTLGVCAWSGYGITRHDDERLAASGEGLPMVAVDYLEQDPAHRILALSARSDRHVTYASMRTGSGDLIDVSVPWQAQRVSGIHSESDDLLASAAARLLVGADAQAISDIASLGFGGIYVSADTAGSERACERLTANIMSSGGVQSVAGDDAGTYFRLTLIDPLTQGIDMTHQHEIQSSVWRRIWLWCMAVVIVLYCVVAWPRAHRYDWEEA